MRISDWSSYVCSSDLPVAADSTALSGSAAATPPAASRAARAHGRSSLCARHAGLAERTGQKIVLQRQLPDLGVKLLHVHHRRRGARTAPEHLGGTVEKLRPPSRDLVRMNVELLRQLRQRLLATDRRQGHLRLERPTLVPSGPSHHLVLLSRGIRSEEHTSEL